MYFTVSVPASVDPCFLLQLQNIHCKTDYVTIPQFINELLSYQPNSDFLKNQPINVASCSVPAISERNENYFIAALILSIDNYKALIS